MYKQESSVEYIYATPNTSRRSEEEKVEIVPKTFKEAMNLPANVQWKSTPDKEVVSLKNSNVHNILPATSVPGGHRVIGFRWVFKIKANTLIKDASLC